MTCSFKMLLWLFIKYQCFYFSDVFSYYLGTLLRSTLVNTQQCFWLLFIQSWINRLWINKLWIKIYLKLNRFVSLIRNTIMYKILNLYILCLQVMNVSFLIQPEPYLKRKWLFFICAIYSFEPHTALYISTFPFVVCVGAFSVFF